MTTKSDFPTLLSQPVYDSGGQKIGKAQQVFYDDVTGRPEWVTVKTGMLGHSASFVPVSDAVQSEGHLEVAYSKDKIKGAPSVELDERGHLSANEEHRLYDFYGIKGDGAKQQMRSGEPSAQDQAQARRASAGTAGTAAAAGTSAATMDRGGAMDTQAADPRATTARQDAPQARPADDLAGRPDLAADGGAETMTLSEEELHVRVERRESGRARLHKYVETEEQQQTVPLRHEEVRLIREPITDENRGDVLADPELSESERVVILHEERPVLEKTVEAKERVRLAVEEQTEQQTVRGTVRKEHIKLEDGGDVDRNR